MTTAERNHREQQGNEEGKGKRKQAEDVEKKEERGWVNVSMRRTQFELVEAMMLPTHSSSSVLWAPLELVVLEQEEVRTAEKLLLPSLVVGRPVAREAAKGGHSETSRAQHANTRAIVPLVWTGWPGPKEEPRELVEQTLRTRTGP